MLVFVMLTTIYILTGPFNLLGHTNQIPSPYQDTSLLNGLKSTKAQLFASQALIAELHQKINSTNLLVQALLIELTREHKLPVEKVSEQINVKFGADFGIGMSDELKLAILPPKLPLGHSPTMGSDEIQPPVRAGCFRFQEELAQLMAYDIGGECPLDDIFAQKLMLNGCEPLPKRRCHPKSPVGYVEPTPLPDCLWRIPPDNSLVWDPYTCKNYQCLVDRSKVRGYFDCKGCFDL
uniref:S-adenosyl-L-methionine-dependent methyltransferase n=1 Tax=Bixa orellana TaxID=66672 RepID=A0A9Y1EIA5_BIXOR|nr:S-adenosyl-L-methionine-dependent methyltransferase [Bixa orellana]